MWNNPLTWLIVAAFALLLGVDMKNNPQSWRNIPLRFRDMYWGLYFWPKRLDWARAYKPRHRAKTKSLFAFMATWRLFTVRNVASQR